MKVTELLEADIQLTKKEFDPAVKAFLDEFNKSTAPHPFDRRQSIYNDSVGIGLLPSRGSKDVDLQSIMSFVSKRQGEGSKALKWLCGLADKHGITLRLDIQPIKNAGTREGKSLTKAELRTWYESNGFKRESGDHFVRQPK